MKYQLEYIHFHAGSQNQMDLTLMKAESVPLWVCHPSVIHFEKGFQGGKSAAVDKGRAPNSSAAGLSHFWWQFC